MSTSSRDFRVLKCGRVWVSVWSTMKKSYITMATSNHTSVEGNCMEEKLTWFCDMVQHQQKLSFVKGGVRLSRPSINIEDTTTCTC